MVAATARGIKVTQSVVVRVTNMDEAGEIELTPAAPTVGKPVMAELSAGDVVQAQTVTWLWSSNEETTCDETTSFERSDRIAGATSDTYTPMAAECLRVTARYTDGHGGNKSVMKTVTVGARTSNVPMFTEDDPIIRSVNENAAVGTDVGAADAPDTPDPVAVTDADSGDTPTYTIVSVDPSSGTARFSIYNDAQLQTEEMLDHEEQASYMLEVKATDSTGNSAMVTVTVKVNDVNEEPEIIFGNLVISGDARTSFAENGRGADGSYTVVGADASSASWSLEGADSGDCMTEGSGMSVMLKFGSLPDYESPVDSNTDNIYMVTLKATDSEGNMATKSVAVMVTNVNEVGTVTLSPMSPMVGSELTATLYDPDGVTENSVTWQWSTTMDRLFKDIDMTTLMTYTPVEADVGYYLRATASYTGGEGAGKMTTTSMVTAGHPLLVEYDANNNGRIDRDEAITALRSYRAGEASRSDAIIPFRRDNCAPTLPRQLRLRNSPSFAGKKIPILEHRLTESKGVELM